MHRSTVLKRLMGALFGATALSLSLVLGDSAAEPLKVAFVYVSPVTDAGWTYQHDTRRKKLQKALDGKIKTTMEVGRRVGRNYSQAWISTEQN